MESVKTKPALNVVEEQSIVVKDESDNDRTTNKAVDQILKKKKSCKLRSNMSADGPNPMGNNQHKQQLEAHPINQGRLGIRHTEGHCWRLEYKPYNKDDVLEKLKQEIYEKNVQRELEFEIKSRSGFRIAAREPKSAHSMMPRLCRLGADVTSSVSYSKKREGVPKEKLREQKKTVEQGTRVPKEMNDVRVKSSTRQKNAAPKHKNRVTVGSCRSSVHEGNKGVTLVHPENHETIQETHKTSPHDVQSVDTRIGKYEKPSDQTLGTDTGQVSSSAWIDTGISHRYSDTKIPTNEILEKYFSSNIFPPLSVKSKPDEKEHGHNLDCTSPVKGSTKTEETLLTQPKSEDNKKNIMAWKKESNELRPKIKAFIEKPVPEISPSSLLIHRRSTVADISMGGFSKAGSSTAHAPAAPERKKSMGVVNIHTCPNVNVFTDRSWMYQDRRAEKCRYIRAPQTPIPPISEVFHPNNGS